MHRMHVALGGFVVVSLGLLLALAQSLGALGGRGGHRYELRLSHVAGLVENNAVRIAGVEVGRVERIGVDHDVARLTLRIDDEIVLHEDARAIVRAKSLLGEKYLQLEPGSREAPVLPDGGEIRRSDTVFEIDELLNALEPVLGGDDSLLDAVAPLADTVNALLLDARGQGGEPPIVTREELRRLVTDVGESVARVRRIAETSEEPLGRLVGHAERLVGDPRWPKILARLDATTTVLERDLPGLLARADATLARVETAAGAIDASRARTLGTILDDTAVVTAALRNELAPTLTRLVRDVAEIVHRLEAIDEAALRRFFQREGVKVYVGSRRDAERMLEGVEAPER